MHAMWKGSVAFGLVNVPVKLYAATEDHDVRFHQVHAADGGRVTITRTCSVDGQPVEYKDLAKAYEAPSGQVVVMEAEDFESLPVPGAKEIEVVEFVPAEQVDPVLFDRSYYLEPEARALKPYVLLREALASTDRMALARVVLRHKTQLAALRVRGDVLVLQTMLWPDEVRATSFEALQADVELRPQELSMASSLVDSLSSDFDPDEFHDAYREALLAVIDRKLAGGDGTPVDRRENAGDDGDGVVLDLMAALRESVKQRQATQGAEQPVRGGDEPTAAPSPRKAAPVPTKKASTGAAKAPRKAAATTKTSASTRKTASRAKKPAASTKTEAKRGRRHSA